MQTRSRLFDDFARMASGAFSAVAGVHTEIEQLINQRLERFLAGHNLVTREEFDAVEAIATKVLNEQNALKDRLAELESQLRNLRMTDLKRKPPAKLHRHRWGFDCGRRNVELKVQSNGATLKDE
ncbi:hypothetical protein A1OE_893 [Candidatus Endolissoclinum faulkneri L2]|uniref:Membrane fusogenic activity family protein n=1 Tax=Candidatus Endolissoclinum faulkneri L2 TaxID=1193729 RepID=K7YNH9_9PROT|nr:accessory factor UbiK family protein [Candidatus Endolissoclinum faulkneri]AFX99077.1 hypothetical protein A1OE_893 [Candidatus Endolissoclinum faulkneri L2]